MSTSKPFPALTGSCVCNKIRYRLLTSPLYCYACHCIDCQKSTGSAFYLSLNIELYNLQVLSSTPPLFVSLEKKPGIIERHVECPQCHTTLWASSQLSEAIVDVSVGTLDFPSLMEPDCHIHVDSKLDWVTLPEGAKTVPKGQNMKSAWPKSSLKRLDICLRRAEEVKRRRDAALKERTAMKGSKDGASGEEVDVTVTEGSGEGDKTPTAGEPASDVDDEEFEKSFRETEKALHERLERLSLKLQDEEVTKKMEATSIKDSDNES
jgi:hypothetical protein